MNYLIRKGIFSILLFISSAASSSESLNVVTMDLPPYGYLNEKEKPVGIYAELVDMIVEGTGLPFQHKIYPFARLTNMLKVRGALDITMALPHNSVTEFSIAILPVVPIDIVIIGRNGTVINNFDDLHGKTVGVVRGGKYDERFTGNNKIKKREVKNYDAHIQMLFRHRVSAIIGAKTGIYYQASKLGYKICDFGEPFVVSSNHGWLYIAKKSANSELNEAVRQSAQKVIQYGHVQRVISKYLNMNMPFDSCGDQTYDR